jgi:glycolate oxidase iron-sulfur subunit
LKGFGVPGRPRLGKTLGKEERLGQGSQKGRVLYFSGCATNYLFENVGRSVIATLTRLGVEVIVPKGQMCCGLPIALSGARKITLTNIRRNLEILNRKDVDAVIVDCASCGSALKEEYTHILEELGENAGAARTLGKKLLDIAEYLARFELETILRPFPGRVIYHDPCHLVRSQGVREEPRSLLRRIPGMEFVEMEGPDVCCGGGGTFQWEHREVAAGITKNKIQAIAETEAQFVASGCPGCRLQIYGNLETDAIELLHPVVLLARSLDERPT